MPTGDLNGVAVLVTRPSGQGESLCHAIVEAGGRVVRLPLIEPVALPIDGILEEIKTRIGSYDIVIFISPNAVRFGMQWLGDSRISSRTVIATVGKATRRALAQYGYHDVICPEGPANSEELLKSYLLKNVHQFRILIVRGRGGRGLLAEMLNIRGASVEYAEVYQRSFPSSDSHVKIQDWLDARKSVCLLTSTESVGALVQRSRRSDLDQVFTQPLAVLSERTVKTCRDAGWTGPIAWCPEVDDASLMQCIRDLTE